MKLPQQIERGDEQQCQQDIDDRAPRNGFFINISRHQLEYGPDIVDALSQDFHLEPVLPKDRGNAKGRVPGKVPWGFMFVPNEGNRHQERAARFKNPSDLCQKIIGVEHVFEYLVDDDAVELLAVERKNLPVVIDVRFFLLPVFRRVNLQSDVHR